MERFFNNSTFVRFYLTKPPFFLLGQFLFFNMFLNQMIKEAHNAQWFSFYK